MCIRDSSTTVAIWAGEPPAAVVERLGERGGRAMFSGSPEAIETRLREYVAAGITYFIVGSAGGLDLDNWRRVSEQVLPRFQG